MDRSRETPQERVRKSMRHFHEGSLPSEISIAEGSTLEQNLETSLTPMKLCKACSAFPFARIFKLNKGPTRARSKNKNIKRAIGSGMKGSGKERSAFAVRKRTSSLSRISPNDYKPGRKYLVGPIFRIRQRSTSCDLCHIVLEVYEKILGETLSVPSTIAAAGQEMVYLVEPQSGKRWYNLAGIDAELPATPIVWLQFGELEKTGGLICLSPREPDHCKYSLPRQRPVEREFMGLIDYNLVASWIKTCEALHISHCERSTVFKRQLLDIKLIDIARREVVPDTQKSRYAALSYVWGETVSREDYGVFTARPDLPHNSSQPQKNSWKLPELLPRTVEDALGFAWGIGLSYLWVDLYCIDQSNKSELESQVANMDLIYECAHITLVVLDGQDMDSGIAGLSRPLLRTQQPIFQLGEHRFMATYVDSMWNRQGDTPWDERGWTFQESVLSRRCVYFDRYHTFFRCLEEMFHDTMEVDFLNHTRVCIDQNDSRFWDNGFSLDLRQEQWRFATFDTFVANYTRRKFSTQSNVLNACKGLLNQITRKTGAGFLWGLPLADFSHALLWRPNDEVCISRREGFPSWSWAGWVGRVEYSYWLDDLDIYQEELEEQARSNNDETMYTARYGLHSNEQGLNARWDRFVRNNEAFLQTKGMSEMAGYGLKISSTRASFRLKRVRESGTYLPHVTENMQQSKAAVGDQWVLLDRQGAPLINEVGEMPSFEKTDHFFRLGPDDSANLLAKREAVEFLFIKYFPAIRDHTDNWIFNVVSALLVERGNQGSAKRLASVNIKLKDWIAADPQPVTITLY